MWNLKKTEFIDNREKIGGCQRQEVGEVGKGGEKV